MLEKYMPAATRKVGLDLLELESKKIQLAELEAEIKDYYLKRLWGSHQFFNEYYFIKFSYQKSTVMHHKNKPLPVPQTGLIWL